MIETEVVATSYLRGLRVNWDAVLTYDIGVSRIRVNCGESFYLCRD